MGHSHMEAADDNAVRDAARSRPTVASALDEASYAGNDTLINPPITP